jgi:hypothetical protein
MIHRKYSCQKLTQFSQVSNVLDVATSNLKGFVWRDSCVFQFRRTGPLGINRAYIHFEKPNLL